MARRKIRVEERGSDAIGVRLLGDRNQPEPSTFIVSFPGVKDGAEIGFAPTAVHVAVLVETGGGR